MLVPDEEMARWEEILLRVEAENKELMAKNAALRSALVPFIAHVGHSCACVRCVADRNRAHVALSSPQTIADDYRDACVELVEEITGSNSLDCEYIYSHRYDEDTCPECGANRRGGHLSTCERGKRFAAFRTARAKLQDKD